MDTSGQPEALPPGAQLALHAMRRVRRGPARSGCPVTAARLDDARQAMRALAAVFLRSGRRLRLGSIGELDATPDERTLLNALAAAQSRDEDALRAALRWLAGFEPTGEMAEVTRAAAAAFAAAGWTWDAPEAPRAPEPPFGMRPVRAVG
jgi:hypothetical protein